ncbi:MAG: VCBS repeat-containing protein, partial [Thermoanaerobaculia bacterium]
MPDDMQDRDSREEEVVSTDDRVIGRAFRWSLAVILGLAAVIALVIYLVRRPQEAAPEIAIESEAPVEVERPVAAPEIAFTDITDPAGVAFKHFNGAEGDKLLPESMGSGVAFFDYDNDLDPDLFFVNSTSWPHSHPAKPLPTSALYRNLGDGRFADASRQTGLDITLYGTGVATGDYDGDGWVDVFVTAVGSNRLLRNDEGRFVDVDLLVGVNGDPDDWSTGAAFFDYDNDGDLDLFVCNYVRWSKEIDFEVDFRLTGVGRAYGPPFNYEGAFSYLYRNNGDGTFTDVSAESGIQVRNEATGVPVGKALGVLPIDVDLDGWIDILVANDTVQNFLFHNLGDGTFEEAGAYWGIAFGRNGEATGAMGVDAGYYRNDAELGFAIGNFANEMTSLYISQGDPTLFSDEAIGEGVGAPTRTMLSFGVLFFDYDLDGRLDLLQANGHLEGEINTVDPSQTYEQSSLLFWNAGPEQRQGFIPVATESTGD